MQTVTNSHLIGIELQTGQSQLIFLSREKSWHHFLIVLKLECHFLNIKGQLIIKDLKTAVIHYFFYCIIKGSHQFYQIFQEKSKERKGNHPIIRQQSGWVGSEKGKLLLTFSTIYADAGWVRKSKKRADVTQGWSQMKISIQNR